MREIKFRAWDKTSKGYIREYARVGAYGEMYVSSFHSSAYGKTCPDLIIEQYTGLKDNEGVEIYEGDIVKLSYGIPPTFDILKIIWYSDYYLDMEDHKNITYCGWWFKNVHQNSCSAPAGIEYQDDLEIIGNIHENPELLEKILT